MLAGITGIAAQQLGQPHLHVGDHRGDRRALARPRRSPCAAGSRPAGGRPAAQSVASRRQRCRVARSAADSVRLAASAAAPGSTIRRRSRVSLIGGRAASIEQLWSAARTPRVGATTNVPPPRPRRDSTRSAARSALIASRSVTRRHPEGVGQLAFGRQPVAADEHTEPDASAPAARPSPRRRCGPAPARRPTAPTAPRRCRRSSGRSTTLPPVTARRTSGHADLRCVAQACWRTNARNSASPSCTSGCHCTPIAQLASHDLERLDRAVLGPAVRDGRARAAGRPPGGDRSRRR